VDAKTYLQSLGLTAKRRFAQNFLTDASDLCFIADALEIAPSERVLEIGPGLGALTGFLLDKGLRVAAVEKDRSFTIHLRKHFEGRPLEVYCTDILTFDLTRDLGTEAPSAAVGNIPYNITSPILFWLVAQRATVRYAVLTVQKEVAERITGTPGHEAWGAISVSLQTYADMKLLRIIPKSHFYPVPKVDSAVIRLDFLPLPRYDPGTGELFHEIVARAFQKRRKTLLNALEDADKGRGKALLLDVFTALGIDPKRRPETLAVSEWVLLARQLSK